MKNHRDILLTLGNALGQYRHLWQPEPFLCRHSPWVNSEPKLHQALFDLHEHEVDQLLMDSNACSDWLAKLYPELFATLRTWRPGVQYTAETFKQPRIASGIGGRKWQQINHFSQLLSTLPAIEYSLDWCSGKGYLASTLALHHGGQWHCLEIDQHLCHCGYERASAIGVDATFHCADVLQTLPDNLLNTCQRHTALHACGELHRSMLRQCSSQAEQIILAPCCYHLYTQTENNALSEIGQQLTWCFERESLRIPLLETVTGGQRAKRLRALEMTWRLAYNCWRSEHQHDSEYRTLASAPKSVFANTPEKFFAWAAQQHGLTWSPTINLAPYLAHGSQQFSHMERLGIVRQGIKRYIEYAIVLDLACYLEEMHFRVEIVEFCSKDTTPRNLALIAHRLNDLGNA